MDNAPHGTSERPDDNDVVVATMIRVERDIAHHTKALGMENAPLDHMSADLGHIYVAGSECVDSIRAIPSADIRQREALGDILIGIRIGGFDHISWHIRCIRRHLDRVINYCLDEGLRPGAWTESMQEALQSRKCGDAKLPDDIKRKMMDLRRRPATAGLIATNLAAIYDDLNHYKDLVDKFLGTDPKDRRAIGRILVDIKTMLQHLHQHMKEVNAPLRRLIEYCYAEE